jgi:hypothetical protein
LLIDALALGPLASPPVALTLTLAVLAGLYRLRTKTSWAPLVSPLTRLDAVDSKATRSAQLSSEGRPLSPFACAPVLLTLARTVIGTPR